jgi:hypothetical protein
VSWGRSGLARFGEAIATTGTAGGQSTPPLDVLEAVATRMPFIRLAAITVALTGNNTVNVRRLRSTKKLDAGYDGVNDFRGRARRLAWCVPD